MPHRFALKSQGRGNCGWKWNLNFFRIFLFISPKETIFCSAEIFTRWNNVHSTVEGGRKLVTNEFRESKKNSPPYARKPFIADAPTRQGRFQIQLQTGLLWLQLKGYLHEAQILCRATKTCVVRPKLKPFKLCCVAKFFVVHLKSRVSYKQTFTGTASQKYTTGREIYSYLRISLIIN
jgi:hypothetical protein